ncbi:MAG: hypothetical protein SFU57_06780 [Gemmatimonadales bacterium]|nr:hypothetical protein [Gemmatimonadales bacterium]
MNNWNALLGQAPTSYRRLFNWNDTTTAGADVIVEVHGSATDSYCGKENGGRIDLFRLGSSECPTTRSSFGDIATVLAHELVTVLGWVDGVELFGVAGVSDEFCVATFPGTKDPGPLSTQHCYHDADGIMQLYRFGDAVLGDPTNYWGTRILALSDVGLAASTVAMGSSVAITATNLTAGPFAQYSATVPFGPASYSSQFFPSTSASRTGNSVTGLVAGLVNVTLRPTSAPTGFKLWQPLSSEGRAVSLTVTPPPPVVFKVDRITPDTAGISVPGLTTFTAHVVGAPGTPVTTRWIVIDSRTPTVADTIWRVGSSTLDILIPAGASYAIGLRARPQFGQIIGFEAFQNIPVCTGSALLSGPSGGGTEVVASESSPPTTDAVVGCVPPEEEEF